MSAIGETITKTVAGDLENALAFLLGLQQFDRLTPQWVQSNDLASSLASHRI